VAAMLLSEHSDQPTAAVAAVHISVRDDDIV
jgi:hypothetical protein